MCELFDRFARGVDHCDDQRGGMRVAHHARPVHDDVGRAIGDGFGECVDEGPDDQRRDGDAFAVAHARDDIVRQLDASFVEEVGDVRAAGVRRVVLEFVVTHDVGFQPAYTGRKFAAHVGREAGQHVALDLGDAAHDVVQAHARKAGHLVDHGLSRGRQDVVDVVAPLFERGPRDHAAA